MNGQRLEHLLYAVAGLAGSTMYRSITGQPLPIGLCEDYQQRDMKRAACQELAQSLVHTVDASVTVSIPKCGIYPLTVVNDRYTGVYSEGLFVAWNLEPYDVPEESQGDDITCMDFWEEPQVCGRGATPEEAIASLQVVLKDLNKHPWVRTVNGTEKVEYTCPDCKLTYCIDVGGDNESAFLIRDSACLGGS